MFATLSLLSSIVCIYYQFSAWAALSCPHNRSQSNQFTALMKGTGPNTQHLSLHLCGTFSVPGSWAAAHSCFVHST